MTIRATTAPGLEDVALAEGSRLLMQAGYDPAADNRQVFGLAGVVSWNLGEPFTVSGFKEAHPLAAARSLFHVAVHVAEVVWDGRTLASLLDGIRAIDLEEMRTARSFRVSCTRVGEHDFQSPQVEREVGTLLQERYGTGVDLEGYDLQVKVDITASRAFCGYQLTRRKGLDRRYDWVYHPRVTLRTPIAYGMLVLSGYTDRPGVIHDPFCGSGTILMEAAGVSRDRDEEPPPISGSDRDPEAVEGARSNLDRQGLSFISISACDARQLESIVPPGSLDYIVTNPPFGIRLARGTNFRTLYAGFLAAAVRTLRVGGTLALLVGKRRGVFNRVLQATAELALEHVRIVEMGGVYAALFVLRRTAAEAVVIDESGDQV